VLGNGLGILREERCGAVGITRAVVLSNWNGLRRGDPVEVFCQSRTMEFYSAHVENGVAKWVTVIDKQSDCRKFRHFAASFVSKKKEQG
jgi:hypothetical protein